MQDCGKTKMQESRLRCVALCGRVCISWSDKDPTTQLYPQKGYVLNWHIIWIGIINTQSEKRNQVCVEWAHRRPRTVLLAAASRVLDAARDTRLAARPYACSSPHVKSVWGVCQVWVWVWVSW